MDNNMRTEIMDFLKFYLQRLIPNPCPVNDSGLIESAFEETVLDFQYHYPKMHKEEVKDNILRNQRGLPVFLYRLVRKMHKQGYEDNLKYQIHFLMKVLCGCEIYWSSEIDTGFFIDHGIGAIIGSKVKIGKGFRIFQGCTIGHKNAKNEEEFPRIGDNVVLLSNSQILGNITIGDNVIIGANSLVINDVESGQIVAGNPAKRIRARGWRID